MYRLTHICLAVGFLLLSFDLAFSQVTFNTPTNSQLATGQLLDVPLRVKNFKKVISVQFVVRWDPTVLKLETITDTNLPNLVFPGPDNFGFVDAAQGVLRFAWYAQSVTSVTRFDLDHLFKMRFTVVGPCGSSSLVSIEELIPAAFFFEVTFDGSPIQNFNSVPMENGQQAVCFTVATVEPFDGKSRDEQPQFDLFPNPFSEKLTVRPRSADFFGKCRLEVRDAFGRLVFANNDFELQPSAGTDIAKDQFEKTGIYFLTVRTDRGFFTEKVVLQEL